MVPFRGLFQGRDTGQGCAFNKVASHLDNFNWIFFTLWTFLIVCILMLALQKPVCGEPGEQFVCDWIVASGYEERAREALCS